MKLSIIKDQHDITRIPNPKQVKKISENPRINIVSIKKGLPSNKGIQARMLTLG